MLTVLMRHQRACLYWFRLLQNLKESAAQEQPDVLDSVQFILDMRVFLIYFATNTDAHDSGTRSVWLIVIEWLSRRERERESTGGCTQGSLKIFRIILIQSLLLVFTLTYTRVLSKR